MNTIKLAVCLVLSLVVVNSPSVMADTIKWKSDDYSHYSKGEDLADVLKDLMSFQGIPVVVSTKVSGDVNLRFEKLPPQEVLDRLARLYQLSWYYDGHALFVYRMDETKTATLKLVNLPVTDFTESLKRLGIYDPRYSWKVSETDGFIYFSGPPRYVRLVMETAKAMDEKISQPATSAVVYRWKDGKGIVNFSSSPPMSTRQSYYEVVNLETGAVTIKNADDDSSRHSRKRGGKY